MLFHPTPSLNTFVFCDGDGGNRVVCLLLVARWFCNCSWKVVEELRGELMPYATPYIFVIFKAIPEASESFPISFVWTWLWAQISWYRDTEVTLCSMGPHRMTSVGAIIEFYSKWLFQCWVTSGINLCCSIQLRRVTRLLSLRLETVSSVLSWSQGGSVTGRKRYSSVPREADVIRDAIYLYDLQCLPEAYESFPSSFAWTWLRTRISCMRDTGVVLWSMGLHRMIRVRTIVELFVKVCRSLCYVGLVALWCATLLE